MKKINNWLLAIILTLTACLPNGSKTNSTETVSITPTLPNPAVSITRAPDVQQIAGDFLEYWRIENYHKMYGALTGLSQDAISEEDFTRRYQNTAIDLTLQKMDYEILSSLTNPQSAQVAFRVYYHSALVGDFQRDNVINLSLEDGTWLVQWDEGLILPELRGGNKLALDVTVPARGNIYDKDGNALISQSTAYSIGVVPTEVSLNQIDELWTYLRRLTGKSFEYIQDQYSDNYGDWYVPIGNASFQDVDEISTALSSMKGLVMNYYESRYYYGHGIAPQTIGYAMPIPAEELEAYRRKGYRGDEKVGMAGIEKWSENDLMGQRAADLYIVDQQGQIVTRLAHQESSPAQSIHTTINWDLQDQTQRALEGFVGAAVVLERDTGRVLAMISSPGFDQNIFETSNLNSNVFLQELLVDQDKPLLNRAAQGGYPLGSVSKIITLAAALESGLYTAESTYNCGHEFNELPNLTLYDWTYEKELPASGVLTLPEGLMRSCNPWFWHIGLDLYRQNMPTALSEMARAFGLGSDTGIGQVAEDVGAFPDPQNEGDAVQLAIGQGTMLATPLQVAVFTAAIGNGGTLYRPQLIEQITSPDGQPSFTFQPEVNGYLPISEETLNIIREAMYSVVANRRGTAYERFTGLNYPIYGKTGTSQNPLGEPHAWFAGYTNARDIYRPDIAIVVIAENAGEGSEVGAPIFRRIIEIYYEGKPSKRYPWEKSLYEPFTPTPLFSPTETPLPNAGDFEATES